MEENKELADNPDYPVILSDSNFSDAVKKYKVIVVDFWASWCMPCKMIEPSTKNLAKKHQRKIVFGKMNIDENTDTPSKFNIMSIPTLLVFKDGEMVGNLVGAMPEQLLESKILELLG